MKSLPLPTVKFYSPAVFAWSMSAVALIYAGLFLYFVRATAIQGPVYDFLDWADLYVRTSSTGDWLGYLWTPHNEHRIVLSRLLVVVDLKLLGGKNLAFLWFGLILLAAMIAVLVWETRQSSLSSEAKTVVVPVLVLLLVPSTIATMCSMPAMQVFLHQSAFAVIAIVLAVQSSRSQRWLAIPAAMLAGLGGSGGLLVWPVLVYLFLPSGWRWVAVTTAIGAVFGAVYLSGVPTEAALAPIDLTQALSYLDYAIRFLGLPWSHSEALVWPSRLIGMGVLGAATVLIFRSLIASRPLTRLERIGSGLLLFTLLLAIAAALARSNVAVDRQMPIRYALFAALGHVGILLASTPWIEVALSRFAGAARSVVAMLALVLLAQQVTAGILASRDVARYNDAWSRFVAGQWTPDMEHDVYPDRDIALLRLRELQNAHLYGL